MSDELTRVEDDSFDMRSPDVIEQKLQFEKMTDDELNSALETTFSNSEQKVNEPPVQEQAQEQKQEAPSNEGQAPEVKQEAQEQQSAEAEKSAQVEQAAEQQKSAFDELVEKKGFKSKEDLAKSYINLEKSYSSKRQMSIAETTQQQVPREVQPLPQEGYDDFNQRILADFNRDPVTTMKALNKVLIDQELSGVREQLRDQKLRSTIDTLASSPVTASFNDPKVQEEMQKIYNQNPSLIPYMSENMSMIYEMAEGRLSIANRSAATKSAPKVKPARVEGSSQPAPVRKGFDPQTASDDELRSAIAAAWNVEASKRRY